MEENQVELKHAKVLGDDDLEIDIYFDKYKIEERGTLIFSRGDEPTAIFVLANIIGFYICE